MVNLSAREEVKTLLDDSVIKKINTGSMELIVLLNIGNNALVHEP